MEFISYKPIPKLRVIAVDVECGVDQMSVAPLAIGDRMCLPFVKRLRGESQYPTRECDGYSVTLQVNHERVLHFGRTA